MSIFMVNIGTIQGEATQAGFENQIECSSMRHAITLTTVGDGQTRVEGTSRHGPISLSHTIDKASPALKLAAALGTGLGQVTITRLRNNMPAETVTMNNAYVVRIDTDTPLDEATREPAEEATETFCLEYDAITWEFKHVVNGVEQGQTAGSWSVALQTIEL